MVEIVVEEVFENAELERLLDEDSSESQEELARLLGVNQQAGSQCLKNLGLSQKQGYWLKFLTYVSNLFFEILIMTNPAWKRCLTFKELYDF